MIEPTFKMEASEELVHPGHLACQGCGATIAMRYVLKALGKKTVVVIPACCWSIIVGLFPSSCLDVPLIHTAFETAAAAATGVRAALDVQGQEDVNVLAWAGDGGTFDIGFQALSGAAERNENIVYCCYDNEAYMNTGIQRSSSTPFGAATTTSPAGKVKPGQVTWKKNMPEIAVAHNIPYVATACPSYPFDLMEKVKKAAEVEGPAYIHILSVCPTGWRLAPDLAIRAGRLAVETGIFPLYEVENGKYTLSVEIPKRRPVEDYLKIQGRFRHLTPDLIQKIQEHVDKKYNNLLAKVRFSEELS